MPKIFEYIGFVFFFYSNDHPPIHCHVRKGDKEVKVELEFIRGQLVDISIRMASRETNKLTSAEREKIRKFVEVYYVEIKDKWEDFRAGKKIRSRKINKEIK